MGAQLGVLGVSANDIRSCAVAEMISTRFACAAAGIRFPRTLEAEMSLPENGDEEMNQDNAVWGTVDEDEALRSFDQLVILSTSNVMAMSFLQTITVSSPPCEEIV